MLLKATRVLLVIFRGLLMKFLVAPLGVSLRQSTFVFLVFRKFCRGARFNGLRITATFRQRDYEAGFARDFPFYFSASFA